MDKQEQKVKNNEKNFVVMLLILVVLIIIAFLLVRNLGFIEHRPRIPTGNVDIFDIIFKKDCENNCNCNCVCSGNSNCNCSNSNGNSNNSNSNSNSNSNNNNSNNNENSSGNIEEGNNGNTSESKPNIPSTPNIPNVEENLNGIDVFDRETEYSQDTQLNIFTNTAYYVVDNKIAPASENSYQFVIRNNNDFNIKYDLDLYETNNYDINMKYRLKLNGIYIAGNDTEWLTYDELQQKSIGLAANTYDVYTLDWKWFESKNDTEIGTNINSNYKLELKISAIGS